MLHPIEVDRRSGRDRRVRERRRMALPPLGRLVPALLVVAVSLVDLGVAQAKSREAWSLLVVLAAVGIAAYDLANPWRWRWHLTAVWAAVSLYVMAAGVHVGLMLAR